MSAETRLYRVECDVTQRFLVVVVALDQARTEPLLEEMADEREPGVEVTRVLALEPLHSAREIGLRRLDEEMKVVGHQAVGVDLPAVPADDPISEGQKLPAIVVV